MTIKRVELGAGLEATQPVARNGKTPLNVAVAIFLSGR